MQANTIRFSLLVSIIILFGIYAEEQSILNGARIKDYDLSHGWTWNDYALIDGNFKSFHHATRTLVDGDGKKEFKIILLNEERIIVVFV